MPTGVYPRESAEARFLAGFIAEPNTGCWLWIKSIRSGYGQIRANGVNMGAHQLSYLIHNGPLRGLTVCHRCDVKSCVNPEHLFLGSQSDNMADAYRKGRLKLPNFGMRTACGRGHEYTAANTYIRKSGRGITRLCRTCNRMHARARRARCLKNSGL